VTALSLPWDGSFGLVIREPEPVYHRGASATVERSNEAGDDQDLILRAQRGDEEAFRGLVEKYRRRAYWVAYNLVSDEDEARDISQEAFIRVFKSLGRFDLKYKFYTWLYQIVTNLSIDALRKRRNQRGLSLDEVGDVRANQVSAHERLERAELKDRVASVLALLPPKYRAVITLREIEGLSSKEIAEIVGSTHATVRWRLHRARLLFRDAWEAKFGRVEGAAPLAADREADPATEIDEEAGHEV
jgi:RNA polymerase sigma-70 factor (ECF subfamily)